MVALALTSNGSISDADTTTGWTGDTFVLEPDIKTQGTNSVSWAATANGTNDAYVAGTWNLSSTHLRLSINLTYLAYWAASNAVQIYLSDGTNTDYVTVFNTVSDYGGGWKDVIVDTALFTTVTLSSITQVGLRVNCASKPRNVVNSFADNWRYSNGLVITSTTTETVSFTQAAAEDAVNVYGIVVLNDGVLFTSGEIYLGGTGAENANIVSVNETIVFPDRLVTTALYKIVSQQGTGSTDIDIQGLVCKTVGGTGTDITFNSNLNSFSLRSSSFISAGSMVYTPTVASPVFSNNTFTLCGTTTIGITSTGSIWDSCDAITISGSGVLTNGSVRDSTATYAVTVDTLSAVSNVSFYDADSSGTAVYLNSGASLSQSWNCLDPDSNYVTGTTGNGVQRTGGAITGTEHIYINDSNTGNTYNISVASGAVTPSVATAGAIVNVTANQRTISFTVNPLPSPDYEWRFYQVTALGSLAGATPLVTGAENETSATISNFYSYTYTPNTYVCLQIIANGYEEALDFFTLEDNNMNRTINLDVEENT